MTPAAEKRFECAMCGHKFPVQSLLDQHLRIHSEKPFACVECDASFASRFGFVEHMRSHTGFAPYVCQECGQKFTHKRSFKFHRRSHAPKDSKSAQKEHLYECPQCTRKFAEKSHLMVVFSKGTRNSM
ncbi:hypothetical protein AAVH_29216 [Aphelenchoides avenae]|nr:hypothetical protein AAVH_29216 [Aphelenchus avenae]